MFPNSNIPAIPTLFTPPAPPTPEVQAANQIKQQAQSLLQQMTSSYMQAYNSVWNNPQVNAAHIIAQFGTEAVALFTRSAQLAAYLVSQGVSVPTTTPQDAGGNFKWNITANSDGSMTVVANPSYTGV